MSASEPSTKGERTRAEIMAAAHQLFLVEGYRGASMRRIAGEAGLALGGIYNYFHSKEDIFAAVFIERHPYLEILPVLDTAQGLSMEEMVRDAAQRMVGILESQPDFLNLMFTEMIELKGRHLPALVEKVLPQMDQFTQRFAMAQARGEVRRIPLLLLMRAFLGLFVSYFISEQMVGDFPPEFRSRALDTFIDIFLCGILSGPVARHRSPAQRPPRRSHARPEVKLQP